MKAAVVQMRSGLDPAQTADVLWQMLLDAISQGATYIQTPEMTGCLHSSRDGLSAVLMDEDVDPIVQLAKRISAAHGVTIHIGSTAVPLDNGPLENGPLENGSLEGGPLKNGMVANRAFMFENGTLKASYDKIHMFDVDLDNGESWRESNTYQPGENAVTTQIDGVRIGMAICYDVRFPELFRDQAVAGAHVLTAPAAFTKQTGEAHWHVLQRARAIENGAFMISAAQGGRHEDGRQTYGHSIIVDPWGRVLAEVEGDEPGIAIADIDVEKSIAARRKIPNLENARDYQVVSV